MGTTRSGRKLREHKGALPPSLVISMPDHGASLTIERGRLSLIAEARCVETGDGEWVVTQQNDLKS